MVSKLPGVSRENKDVAENGSNNSQPKESIDEFLERTIVTTKYISTAWAILSQASAEHGDVGGAKATVDAIAKARTINEVGAQVKALKSSSQALGDQKDTVALFQAHYNAANVREKAAIRDALFNFALFIPRLAEMPKNVRALVNGIITHPTQLAKIGQLRTAGSLLKIQLEGTQEVVKILPQLLKIAHVTLPKKGEAAQGKDVAL